MGNGGSDWGRVGLQAKLRYAVAGLCVGHNSTGHSAAEAFIKSWRRRRGTESNEVSQRTNELEEEDTLFGM